jgi:hypothetical protein
VVTLISLPARTLVSPVTRKSLPLRLRTIGGPAGGGAPFVAQNRVQGSEILYKLRRTVVLT